MNKHEKAALDDLLQWRNETRKLDDVIASQRARITELHAFCGMLLEEYEGGGYCPSEKLISDVKAALARSEWL